ncbi:unnamed protein product [Cercospora beticola]|nr:unnamed protein product [Cercospora beticola]
MTSIVKQLGHQNDHFPKTSAKKPANEMDKKSKKEPTTQPPYKGRKNNTSCLDSEPWAMSKYGGLGGNAQNLELQQKDVWAVEAIVDEDRRNYKLRWAGVNNATGEKWPDSWEPKKNVGMAVIREWKERNEVGGDGQAEQAATGGDDED